MAQVKTFKGYAGILDNEINDWLKENSVKIINVAQCNIPDLGNGEVIITVFFDKIYIPYYANGVKHTKV